MLVSAYAQHPVAQFMPPSPATPMPFQNGTAPVFRACASEMQRPTLSNVRIRSTRDANQIFYAVARNLLPMTVRRLDAEERRAITSGNVYVWEERGVNSEATGMGIERWTDGMRWSPSRVRDEFLFYHQKEMSPDEAAELPPTRWARVVNERRTELDALQPKAANSDTSASDASPDKIPTQQPSNDQERLIKQTYSVLVTLPEDRQRNTSRKWHLTAYFTQATVDSLSTVDKTLSTPQVTVPEGWFRSARAGKSRRDPRQRQIFNPQNSAPDMQAEAGPSGSSPASHLSAQQFPLSASFPPPQSQYSGFVQEDDRMQVDGVYQRPPLPPPPMYGSYTIPPVPPPPPHDVTPIARGPGPDLTDDRMLRERERDRNRHECERPPLPNTFDPTSMRIVPSHLRAPSFTNSYANVPSPRMSSRLPPSNYYQKNQPAESFQNPIREGVHTPGTHASYYHQRAMCQSYGPVDPNWQARPQTLPPNLDSHLGSQMDSPPLHNRSLLASVPTPIAMPIAQPPTLVPSPAPSPPSSTSRLMAESNRALIPLDNLENAIFPRRDPMDDALLRRFNGLRTTPLANSEQ
ncbi:hypothetical protein EW145_g3083 [Phellinidium pouzarii]|uniref:cAMP-independent regulatory protein pac2 n=1 Tax=Phellinidium pouzarii TaxID=167371 RepID=A0A4S4L9Z7_9AGAM|nr:hypothetical protein EW145_g3083 [Phellinidium pouzarii]